jgi:hypothetical protein
MSEFSGFVIFVVTVFGLLHSVICFICLDMSDEHLPPSSVWLNWSTSQTSHSCHVCHWFSSPKPCNLIHTLPCTFSLQHLPEHIQSSWRWRQYICIWFMRLRGSFLFSKYWKYRSRLRYTESKNIIYRCKHEGCELQKAWCKADTTFCEIWLNY